MRKFMMIEYWRGDNGEPCVLRTVNTYDKLLKRIYDEHYSEGICLAFTIIPADDDGNFGDTSKIEEAILK